MALLAPRAMIVSTDIPNVGRQLGEVLRVLEPIASASAALVEPLRRELADRLEHRRSGRRRRRDEALVDERLEHVDVRLADGLGRLERAAAREDGEPREQLLLVSRRAAPSSRRSSPCSVRWRSGRSRAREDSSGSAGSSRSSSSAGSSTRTRAAASSIASGSRSTRSQIAAHELVRISAVDAPAPLAE